MSDSRNGEGSGPQDAGPENSEIPAAPDPWKGFRGVCAGTLVLEAIVILLALPIVANLGGGVTWLSGGLIIGSAIAMVLGAGVQGRSWAMKFNITIQVILLFGAFVDLSIGAVGVIFGVVWAYLLYLRRDLRIRMEKGLLPSQQPRTLG
ncbi:DUF4233 domain-containing protein [Rhodococcus triatomae]|uniref:DUF4233 domain-containing protein n=1 Tax=Rhodococcus triatomae TaxID=300028 RepID=A0A1G8DQT0_9NOCA|nr:DUF4233 domain-containing protein [Rhodococcus triatomae]QNG21963.1 DUF4233 domain-containing protein [Rhodococcus triatomae]SDH60066.1 Protein of unknown function [Rhodococcus triatomae]